MKGRLLFDMAAVVSALVLLAASSFLVRSYWMLDAPSSCVNASNLMDRLGESNTTCVLTEDKDSEVELLLPHKTRPPTKMQGTSQCANPPTSLSMAGLALLFDALQRYRVSGTLHQAT